ncbi:transcriptional regulator [Aliarcobacter butzleri]|uniref:transcriptional regulator n=1 Tax=Aliarcobacter butzleri TaxID=28197 RepID=UPI0021B22D13|nr:transcriptional regulator [Aliarcobacter butzleri]MCT7584118.1 transcriptional regulator [Aliarcobacter butzleri]
MFEENPELFLDKVVEKVKKERIQRKISQLKLANILGFSSPNYIAKAFDMEVIELLPQNKKKS